MFHAITADWGTLLRQSQETASDYFKAALNTLERSGLEFKAADVVALAQVMATDFQSTCLVVGLNNLADTNV
jgi:hypothetical protein